MSFEHTRHYLYLFLKVSKWISYIIVALNNFINIAIYLIQFILFILKKKKNYFAYANILLAIYSTIMRVSYYTYRGTTVSTYIHRTICISNSAINPWSNVIVMIAITSFATALCNMTLFIKRF